MSDKVQMSKTSIGIGFVAAIVLYLVLGVFGKGCANLVSEQQRYEELKNDVKNHSKWIKKHNEQFMKVRYQAESMWSEKVNPKEEE